MIILRELLIILSIIVMGDLIASILPIPIPGNVVGMLLLLGLLWRKILKPKHIQYVSAFLLTNMAFFFIPAGVGVMKSIDLVEGKILQVILVCVISTVITFAVTGLCAQTIIRHQERKRDIRNGNSH